ncbi:uncharacterized protein LOC110973709 isoform X2 [Acanthaster planci]|uniref:Uncharacterized protein LOC110973709 isoform X2 n=1 Tax=Acanthaster planci TaxID=133434 RepID=A0A8B7XHZ7_ACAPL|nr:uncharacterized protein LOC110973709 isoform X2 [Acanthaster planci]
MMTRGSRHVHYDDEIYLKKPKGSYHRRQRRRRRVSRRAKIYGAAFLLALTGFFCLVPGTSLTVVAFTNGTNSKENILRLLGPVFAGVGVILVGISTGLVCYAMLYKRKVQKAKKQQRQAAEDIGNQGSGKNDGHKLAAEVRLLEADSEDTGALKVKHALVPNRGNHRSLGNHRSVGFPVDGTNMPASTVIVDIVHPPPESISASLIEQAELEATIPRTSQTSNKSFQMPDKEANAQADFSDNGEQCKTILVKM